MRRALGFAVLGTLVLGCGSAGGGTATGGLKGRVMRGPTMPVCRVGVPCEEPARGVKLDLHPLRQGRRPHDDEPEGLLPDRAQVAARTRSAPTAAASEKVPSPSRVSVPSDRFKRVVLPYRHRHSLADNQVHELPGDDDLLADLLAVQKLLNPRRGLRLRDQLFLRGIGRDLDPVTNTPVDLDHELERLALEQRRIRLRPRMLPQPLVPQP